jgi:tRNA-guanine family transglycosylase
VTQSKLPDYINTSRGLIKFPAYFPVTTFGEKYPLDGLVRPYLSRLAPAIMVSLHYARQMKERPTMPMLIDSGGFASLFEGATVVERRGLGLLETTHNEKVEVLHPKDVLEFQEQHADIAFTLDFPVPPSMDPAEGKRRVELTIANAKWALQNRRRKDMLLYACVQGWDVDSFRACAKAYAGLPFDGLAIGGMVPRVNDFKSVLDIVDSVRSEVPDKPLHVFGLGKPELVDTLFKHGVQSVDSSSYVKLAADGKLWGQPTVKLGDASPAERLQLALCNLAMATQRVLPLSTSHLRFGFRAWESVLAHPEVKAFAPTHPQKKRGRTTRQQLDTTVSS